MQIKSSRIKSYRSRAIADRASSDAIARLKKLGLYNKFKEEACSSSICLEAIGWSKATYCRWHRSYQEQGMAGLCVDSISAVRKLISTFAFMDDSYSMKLYWRLSLRSMTATMLRGIFYTRSVTPEYSGILFFSPLLNARILIF